MGLEAKHQELSASIAATFCTLSGPCGATRRMLTRPPVYFTHVLAALSVLSASPWSAAAALPPPGGKDASDFSEDTLVGKKTTKKKNKKKEPNT